MGKGSKRALSVEAKASLEQKVGKIRHVPRSDYTPPVQHMRTQPKKTAKEKRLRALAKRLRELEALDERRDRGDALDEQQQAKLLTLPAVLSEMEEAVALAGGGSARAEMSRSARS